MSFTSPFGDESFNLGNGMYEEFKIISCYICNGLFSIGEDDFGTRRMTSIWKLSGRHQASTKEFPQLRYCSCTSYRRMENQRADSLARSARRQSSFVVHMDAELPIWFTESIWVCEFFAIKKKIKELNLFC